MARRTKLPKAPYPLPPKLQHKLKRRRKSAKETPFDPNDPSVPEITGNPHLDLALKNKRRKLWKQDMLYPPADEPTPAQGSGSNTLEEMEYNNDSLFAINPIPLMFDGQNTEQPYRPPAATRISLEVFDMIFNFIKEDIMTLPLPDLPIRPRTPADHNKDMDNSRLSNQEVITYKRFLVKKQLYDLGKVCTAWNDRSKDVRDKTQVIIIGEDDGHRAMRNPMEYFPSDSYKPVDLTVQISLPTFVKLIDNLTPTIDIGKLTILHSSQPEVLPERLCTDGALDKGKVDEFLGKLKPRSVHLEWYAGEEILTKGCINAIARTLKRSVMEPEIQAEKLKLKYKTGNYHLPQEWDLNRDIAIMFSKSMLVLWRTHLEKFILRANHMMLLKEIRESVNRGALRVLEYHFVSLPLRTIKKSEHAPPQPWNSPIPPSGSLRSIDNILMWDLRWRDPKWKRRLDKIEARENGEVYSWKDHIPAPPINWKVFGPYDLWKQQKDRSQFKGDGKRIPWQGEQSAVLAAIGDFIIAKSQKWVKPYNWVEKTETDNFEDMIHFVCEKKHKLKKPPHGYRPDFMFYLTRMRRHKPLNEAMIKARILEVRLKNQKEQLTALSDEMASINQPDFKQDEFNRLYIQHWLTLKEPKDLKLLIEKLGLKYGSKELYTQMNWPLTHIAQPGVSFNVEPRII